MQGGGGRHAGARRPTTTPQWRILTSRMYELFLHGSLVHCTVFIDTGQHYIEFLSAPTPGRRTPVAVYRVFQQPCNIAKHLIPHTVPIGVIDMLEMIYRMILFITNAITPPSTAPTTTCLRVCPTNSFNVSSGVSSPRPSELINSTMLLITLACFPVS